jgi:hypothetical protein
VHLLNHSPEAETVATKFAGGNEGRPFWDERGEVEEWVEIPSASASLSSDVRESRWRESSPPAETRMRPAGVHLPPIINGRTSTGSEIVTFRLLCKYLKDKTVEIGDHVVVFGEVLEVFDSAMDGNAGEERREEEGRATMAYVGGRYASVHSK